MKKRIKEFEFIPASIISKFHQNLEAYFIMGKIEFDHQAYSKFKFVNITFKRNVETSNFEREVTKLSDRYDESLFVTVF